MLPWRRAGSWLITLSVAISIPRLDDNTHRPRLAALRQFDNRVHKPAPEFPQ
ncbi:MULTISPECIES: hypothetical protein [unclassified Rhizobium]|uniref:hypothetical protein n=1 Tax=unclassified Rhizobium TaxID=2613769 RepID=UPI001C83954B|nr:MULTISPECIES: hypothetical protein [unclassified Rhizobium]MBX5155977.1 hypothetical protein [Rhizobium sp. NZLR8]MBX5164308.1 hypothetical protein [Rhizobium sp. NZLR4b]MBX5208298.1 hypothetical protein [Rhizobium sp. NZLR11]